MAKLTAVTFKLPVWVQTGLRDLAFYKRVTMQSLVSDAVIDLLQNEGVNPPDQEWGESIRANLETLKKTGIDSRRLELLANCDDLPSQEEKDKINEYLKKKPAKQTTKK